MSALDQLCVFLESQKGNGIVSGDWQSCNYEIEENDRGELSVRIPKVEIGFSFNAEKEFEGIYNYKQ